MKLNPRNTRPPAGEAEIRAMHERAAGHAQRAAEHENARVNLVTEAEQHADAYVKKAQETAAEMVRQAQQQADDDLRDAHMAAQQLADARDEESRGQQYWASLAAEEGVRAGLPPAGPGDTLVASRQSAVETRTDPVAEQNGAQS